MKTIKTLILILTLSFLGTISVNAQSPNNAFGDNQIMVDNIGGNPVYAIYSGDVNQDGFIGGDDVVQIDNDNLAGLFGGYFVSDLNGDSFVSGDDVVLADVNNVNGVFIQRP